LQFILEISQGKTKLLPYYTQYIIHTGTHKN